MASPKDKSDFAFDRPGKYRICVLGKLSENWSDRLSGMQIVVHNIEDRENPMTELTGTLRDQAELSGVLETLYERHLTLVSVQVLEGEDALRGCQSCRKES